MQDKTRSEVCNMTASIVTQEANIRGKEDEFGTVNGVLNPRTSEKDNVIKINGGKLNATISKEYRQEFGTSNGMRNAVNARTTTKATRVVFLPKPAKVHQ